MRLTKKTIEFKTQPVENKSLNKENRKKKSIKLGKLNLKPAHSSQGKIVGNSRQRHKTNNKYFS